VKSQFHLALLVLVAGLACKAPGSREERGKGTTQPEASSQRSSAPKDASDPTDADDDTDDEPGTGPSLFDDATGIPRLYEGKLPQPATLFSLKIKGSRVFLGALQSPDSAHGDVYLYSEGSVAAPTPASDSVVAAATKVPLASLDFKLVPKMIADAKSRASIDGVKVRAVDLYLGGWRVRLVGPRAGAKVDYTLSGDFKKIKKS
jgi:hypothetical protein